jgi:hypothetical protein
MSGKFHGPRTIRALLAGTILLCGCASSQAPLQLTLDPIRFHAVSYWNSHRATSPNPR